MDTRLFHMLVCVACITATLVVERSHAGTRDQTPEAGYERSICFKDHILYTDLIGFSRDEPNKLCEVWGAKFFLERQSVGDLEKPSLSNQNFEFVRGGAEKMIIDEASPQGISRIGWRIDGNVYFNNGLFTYYLYDDGKGSYKFIRCIDGHPEGIRCISHFPDIDRFRNFVREDAISLRFTFPLTNIENYPTYYSLALEIIEKTDFASIIECDDKRYICTGDTDGPRSYAPVP